MSSYDQNGEKVLHTALDQIYPTRDALINPSWPQKTPPGLEPTRPRHIQWGPRIAPSAPSRLPSARTLRHG